MKKVLIMGAMILMIATSLIAGTLATYTKTMDISSGSVVAKEFILLKDGADTFEKNVKIAPTETVSWQFSVKNYDGQTVAETAMDLLFDINVTNSPGKLAIDPLVVTVYDENGEVVGSKSGTGVFQFTSQFPLQEAGQSKTYTVSVYWPSNGTSNLQDADMAQETANRVTSGLRLSTAQDDAAGLQIADPGQRINGSGDSVDSRYAGAGFGTAVSITVTGTQSSSQEVLQLLR
jgi:hypothetical protein